MSSFRKKIESPDRNAPVAAPPHEAKLVEPVADGVKPLELDQPNPVEEASRNALKQRLAEMQNAETIVRSSLSQQQLADEPPSQKPKSVEEIIEGCQLPERAKSWLRAHPDYVTDPAKVAQITAMHP